MSGTPSRRPRTAVSRTGLPGDGVERLAARFDVTIWPETAPPTPAELAGLVRGCEGMLVLGSDRVDAALLDAAGPDLRVVALASMGYDSVDVAAAVERGVVITHTPDVLADTTADVAMALILMARRRLPASMDALRRGAWGAFRMDSFLGLDVQGATLGLIGYGQIARAVARRATGFGMRVRHHHPRRKEDDELSRWVPFDELLRTSDVVSVHTPLTEETQGMIGAAELARMKPTATLVNTGRGGVVDEEALLGALRRGELHSAGLDVMTGEPRTCPSDSLFAEPHLVVLPHVGSATEATRAAMVELAARNVEAVLDGRCAPTPVPGTSGLPERHPRVADGTRP
ncbi:2-hydroxyacid dehydrogenase [Streptomyces scabiei]|uniref:Glyoxylate/hydroxypyruvate reductase B n=1 Tax=Streptomyces scabiei TaxID=1930 RepID=A0A117EEM2_STRSC|nr:D-glycerate dehydrogenase [Streptomyces scabiei]GAQ64235.1 glyoxylate/hydroxypyruvate reductase B [Streptomyces scabiei]